MEEELPVPALATSVPLPFNIASDRRSVVSPPPSPAPPPNQGARKQRAGKKQNHGSVRVEAHDARGRPPAARAAAGGARSQGGQFPLGGAGGGRTGEPARDARRRQAISRLLVQGTYVLAPFAVSTLKLTGPNLPAEGRDTCIRRIDQY